MRRVWWSQVLPFTAADDTARYGPSALLAVALSALTLSVSTQVGPASYDIAFVSERDGRRGIYLMRGDDSRAVPILGDSNAMVFSASWSPDGQKIAYVDYRPEDEELLSRYGLPFHFPLYVMNPDGSDRERVLDVPVVEFAWSPDSRRLAFTSGYEDPEHGDPRVESNLASLSTAIYVLDLASREVSRLTPLGDNKHPSWSPDGRLIVFSGEDPPNGADADIAVVATAGGEWRRVIALPTNDVQPAWSPQGDAIAFVAAPRPGRTEESGVFLARADGSEVRRISSLLASEVAWSPDGRQLLVSSRATTLIDVTTAAIVELATGALEARFAPDGNSVLYRSDDEGDWNIYAVDLAGRQPRRLTSNPGDDLMFAVSPVPVEGRR